MQMLLHEWNEKDTAQYGEGWTNVIALEPLRRLQAELGGPPLDDACLRRKLEENLALIERFAQAIQARAADTDPGLARYVAAPAPDTQPFDIAPLTIAPRVLKVTAQHERHDRHEGHEGHEGSDKERISWPS
jgi:hypothetical protein